MANSRWQNLLSAMAAGSGEAIDGELSDDVASKVEEITGMPVPVERRIFARHVPSVALDDGLSDTEIAHVEERFGFSFPPDLRELLQTALPIGDDFPNWRSGEEEMLRSWLRSPLDGVIFDVEHNGFWLPEWGPRPEILDEALRRAEEFVAAAPRLIPIYGHRMIAAEPHEAGNPVFSVHQTDIIYYGFALADYLRHEFDLPDREPWPGEVRPIRFWDVQRFQEVRWSGGPCVFDDRAGVLPEVTAG